MPASGKIMIKYPGHDGVAERREEVRGESGEGGRKSARLFDSQMHIGGGGVR